MARSEYKVDGYDVYRPEYDGPYLDGADFDPAEDFRYAGDPRQAEDNNKERAKKREAYRKAREKALERRRKEREDGGHLGTSGNPDQPSNAAGSKVEDLEPEHAAPEAKVSTEKEPNRTDEIHRKDDQETAERIEQVNTINSGGDEGEKAVKDQTSSNSNSNSNQQVRRPVKKSAAKKATSTNKK